MPEAQNFKALGAGNGFPYCLTKSDISSFSHWVTLGGYKQTDSGSPVTQAQIDLSLKTAMNLWWNAYRFNIDIEMKGTNGGSTQTYTQSFFETTPNQPSERASETGHGIIGGGIGPDPSVYPEANVLDFFTAHRGSYQIQIHRYYNGDKENESNFIGYGLGRSLVQIELRGISDLPSQQGSGYGFIRATAQYRLDSITPPNTSSSNALGYTTISGIPLVYSAYAVAGEGGPSDPASTVNFGANGAEADSPYYGCSVKVMNPSIDFWTYST